MGWLDRLMGKAESEKVDAPAVEKTQAVNLNDGVHHEIFLDDEAIEGRYKWLCRVYAADGTPHQNTGSEESVEQSTVAAMQWADAKKAELRRMP